MTFLESVLPGILQGLTEFLPISSTAHLTLAAKIMNIVTDKNSEQWTAFIAVIQMGTLLSVIIYFRKQILNIISDFFRDNVLSRNKIRKQGVNSRLGWMIIIGTIPVAIIGFLFKDVIEGPLTKNLYVIAWSLIGFAILLLIAEKAAEYKKNIAKVTMTDAIIVGIAQVFALIPGSSRSGATIAAGLFAGMNRETAARFSFLLSIPAITASGIFEFYRALKFINNDYLLELLVASSSAAIVGYISIGLLLRYLQTKTTLVFVLYRIILGVIILILLSD